MDKQKKVPESIDAYIALQKPQMRGALKTLRATISKAAPNATEKISWAMPTYYQGGNLVHFAAGKNHIGLYPGAESVQHFLPKLTEYKTSKGAIQFPISKPLPLELVQEIVLFCVQQRESESESEL